MKKLLALIVVLGMASALTAQDLPPASKIIGEYGSPRILDGEVYLLDSMLIYVFDQAMPDSFLIQKQYFRYADYEMILVDSSLARYFDTTQWMYYDKREYTYDAMNRLIRRTDYLGNLMVNVWLPDCQITHFHLDGSPLVEYSLLKNYNSVNQSWERRDSTYNTYDLLQQNDFSYRYIWDEGPGVYKITEYHHYAYNAQGLLTGDTIYSYWTPGIAKQSYLRVYTYDANGNELTHTAYNWNEATTEWDEVERHVNTYNALGNRISNYRYEWDDELGQWENIERGFFTYDENNNMQLWMYWDKDEDTGVWERDFTMKLFWSLHTIIDIVEPTVGEELSLFPNPSGGLINLRSASDRTISIYDMSGQLHHLSRVTTGDNLIDLSRLKPGLYLLSTENGQTSCKILIR